MSKELTPVWTLTQLPGWAQKTFYLDIFDAIEAAGGQVRFVGGAVRNTMMRLPVADVDMATTLKPETVVEALKRAKIKGLPTGIDHGTVTAVRGQDKCEITTLREDVETDGRHAKVVFTDDWVKDAERRDFTMNTLLMDKKCQIYDPLGKALDDIKKKAVAFVGSAEKRIQEDALRIYRYYRFIAYYGTEPDSYTQAICLKHAGLVHSLSKERITEELRKILSVDRFVDVIEYMNKSKVLPKAFQVKIEKTVLKNFFILQKRYDLFDLLSRFKILLNSEISLDELKETLSLSNKELSFIENLKYIGDKLNESEDITAHILKELAYRYGKAETLQGLLVYYARKGVTAFDEAEITLLAKWPVPELPLSGKDLQKLGMKQGPEIGKVLETTENWWIESNFKPDKDACLEFAKGWL